MNEKMIVKLLPREPETETLRVLLSKIADVNSTTVECILSPLRTREVVTARRMFIAHLRSEGNSKSWIASQVHLSRAAVIWHLNQHEWFVVWDRDYKKGYGEIKAGCDGLKR